MNASTRTATSAEAVQPTGKQLYRVLWRWHFYAGIYCIPFVLTLALSGAIYLFKPQIDQWTAQSLQNNIPAQGSRLSPEQEIQAALAAVPGGSLAFYQLPERANQVVTVGVEQVGRTILAYVNPYTGEVLQTEANDAQFIRQVRTFHGELLMGKVGSVLVELAACWAIVLILTGLFLWWPRGRRRLGGVLYPRLRQGGRLFWRDLHAVVGFWIAALTLFLLISGLPWALVWGSAFKEIRSWGEPQLHQDWTISEHQHHGAGMPPAPNHRLSAELVQAAQALDFAPPVHVQPPSGDDGVWTVKSQHQNRPLRADAWVDGETGEVLRIERFADRPLLDRIVGIGVAAHEGQLFGWFNQLLGLITALGLVTLSVSGCVIWWKRRPSSVLGAPPRSARPGVEKGFAIAILAVALSLPLLLISLVAILVLEWILLRRLPRVQRWLGLSPAS